MLIEGWGIGWIMRGKGRGGSQFSRCSMGWTALAHGGFFFILVFFSSGYLFIYLFGFLEFFRDNEEDAISSLFNVELMLVSLCSFGICLIFWLINFM